MDDGVQTLACLGAAEYDCPELFAVNGLIGSQNLRAKGGRDLFPGFFARQVDFVADLIGVNDERAAFGQQLGDSALARAYATGQSYGFHTPVCCGRDRRVLQESGRPVLSWPCSLLAIIVVSGRLTHRR